MRVGMCDCDCVPVFLSGWVFGYPLSWIILGPPSNGRPICPCHTPCQWLVSLPAGVLVVLGARAWCSGMCRLVVAAWRGLDPRPPVRVLLGSVVHLGHGSLGPWLDLL
ncbi:hypothetical protein ILYODFUR_030234 [Ilyodon furcidens]|uniref:Uncharacterized protein n=1 Tax=Ilyodon furcidens TaxID=33524 RepID=A0ABV0TYY7_9TELE